eukprot:TRINITY_DN30123_c0_g1_i1.p1 TRINITY_DN30123_c0_g1~~TRINITY_DN30123_c0_g1_i1.p1  ORF type:complete len:252 (-),score=71.39 TRINITY_DN30123_c0_g1_i1:11-766(-)
MGCCQASTVAGSVVQDRKGKGKRDGDNLEEVVLTEDQEVFEHWAPKSPGSTAPRPVAPPPTIAAKAPQSGGFGPGQVVRIHGLSKADAKLNGETGKLESFNNATNHWSVRLSNGDLKFIDRWNLEKVIGDVSIVSDKKPAIDDEVDLQDPPLLEVWQKSERAKAAQKLLDPGAALNATAQPLKGLDLTVPVDLLQQAKRSGSGGDDLWMESDPDAQMLSLAADERVVLDDLDSEMLSSTVANGSRRQMQIG